jgi:acyl-CoA thioester hydrolase
MGNTTVEGKIDITTKGAGYLVSPELPEDIYIRETDMLNALNGDLVKVKLFARRRGRKQEGEVIEIVERARTEWLRSLGVEQQSLKDKSGGMFVVSETHIKYLQSAKLDDLLRITAQLQTSGRASLTIAQKAWRDDQLLCEGTIRIGWVHVQDLKPARIPSSVLERLL